MPICCRIGSEIQASNSLYGKSMRGKPGSYCRLFLGVRFPLTIRFISTGTMPSNEPTTVVASQPTIPVEAFIIETFAYKVIQGQPILLDLWVPKNLPSGERPVILRFHGGYLVCGSRDNLQLTPPRIIQYALDNKLILVSCDYRLLPESSGKGILEDIEDLWSWVHGRLQQALEVMTNGRNTADLQRVLLAGESAGMWFTFIPMRSN